MLTAVAIAREIENPRLVCKLLAISSIKAGSPPVFSTQFFLGDRSSDPRASLMVNSSMGWMPRNCSSHLIERSSVAVRFETSCRRRASSCSFNMVPPPGKYRSHQQGEERQHNY